MSARFSVLRFDEAEPGQPLHFPEGDRDLAFRDGLFGSQFLYGVKYENGECCVLSMFGPILSDEVIFCCTDHTMVECDQGWVSR
jgi:hypothetical protein